MRQTFLLAEAILLLALCTPCFAKGQHISCHMIGAVYNSDAEKKEVERTLNFYLDDSNEQLVAEGGDIQVRATMYSDTMVDAEIADNFLGNSMSYGTLFGAVMNGSALLKIDRIGGHATIVAQLLPSGAETETGDCRVVSPPATKF